MKKVFKAQLISLLVMLLIIAALYIVMLQRPYRLYVGDGCPHCAIVEQYIKDNNIDAKLTIVQKEVWHNEQNNAELLQVGAMCGLKGDNLGIPLLYAEGNCYDGDQPVINFIKSRVGQ